MTIAVPTAGSPVLDTWGADVANRLNRLIPLSMTADQSTDVSDGSGGAEVDDLRWAVVAGRVYTARLSGGYIVSATNQGLKLAIKHPGGNLFSYVVMTGNGSPTGKTEDRITSSSTFSGRTSTDNAFTRNWWLDVHYECTTSGTLIIEFARGGSSGGSGVTLNAGSGGLVIESE